MTSFKKNVIALMLLSGLAQPALAQVPPGYPGSPVQPVACPGAGTCSIANVGGSCYAILTLPITGYPIAGYACGKPVPANNSGGNYSVNSGAGTFVGTFKISPGPCANPGATCGQYGANNYTNGFCQTYNSWMSSCRPVAATQAPGADF